ncbi:MAG: hypothetical protein PUB49_02930 [Selenomonadaceae bacterium]|nr:hypothetical protein [Selenomonadaceae bacterium]
MDSLWQWIQIIMIFTIPILLWKSNIADIIQVGNKVKANSIELLIYYAVRHGDLAVSIFLMFMLVKIFYKINEKKTLNIGIRYHDHSMIYYRFCAILLGYRKCSLLRVPIGMQFRLVMNDCFEEYDDGGDATYRTIEEESISIRTIGTTDYGGEINLCIEDTYPIKDEYIPLDLQRNKTIKISRYKEIQQGIRCDSKKLIDAVAMIIKSLPEGKYTVNIMATTNVRNTIRIANDVFKTGGRGNIEHLNVYKQKGGCENKWGFSSGMKVF